jgi:hypothetical protein
MSAEQLRHFAAALADRYRVGRELGRGGMATVYPFLAKHDPLLEAVRDDDAYQGLMQHVHRRWQAFSW